MKTKQSITVLFIDVVKKREKNSLLLCLSLAAYKLAWYRNVAPNSLKNLISFYLILFFLVPILLHILAKLLFNALLNVFDS